MRLSNKAKHDLAVKLISDHLVSNGYEHMVFGSDKYMDIYVPVSGVKIKVFCNYSASNNVKVSSDFVSQDDVVYLVVKLTNNNTHGFTCFGGEKSVIDNSIKEFDKESSFKNIQISLLRNISITKLLEKYRHAKEQKGSDIPCSVRFTPRIRRTESVKSCTPLIWRNNRQAVSRQQLIQQH